MNPKNQKIVFIGSGKVATALSMALKGKREIIQVYSKALSHARKLGKKLGCSYTNDIHKITPEADTYIIAIKDDAIAEMGRSLSLQGKIVVHTSGSVNMDSLKKVSDRYGVIYPLYSFLVVSRKSSFKDVPFFIEASDKKTGQALTALVKDIKGTPYYMDSEKRAMVHLAAVFVNNFPNHLFTIAEKLSKEAGIPFALFLPLAKETVENMVNRSPALNQTGPASRNDQRIIKRHLALLSEGIPLGKSHPIYRDIYEVLTKSIIKTGRV